MKKILITGAGSYIGTSFQKYLNTNYQNDYSVDTVDMIDNKWREKDFSPYDTVFHVSGIAHQKETKENSEQYYIVNRDLAIETAKKSKLSGVKQFVFLSSMSVYGKDLGTIIKNTFPTPKSNYGKSKLQAEENILTLEDESFKVCILRPPMIYGKGCKGNYPSLVSLALKLPVFPKVQNERSMLYIENLCEFVRLMIENEESGTFFPQNSEYSNTSELVQMIAAAHGKKIRLMVGFTWLLKIMSHFTGLVNKAFGSLTYDKSMSIYKENYIISGLTESISKSESTVV